MFRHAAFAAPQREFHQLWRIEVFVQTAARLDGDFRLGEGQGHVINGLSRSVGTIYGDASKIGREVMRSVAQRKFGAPDAGHVRFVGDRESTRLNSSR